MKYFKYLLITWALGALGFYIGGTLAEGSFLFSILDIALSILIGFIPGLIIFILILPVVIWGKKRKRLIITIINIIGFLAVIYFTYGLIVTTLSV